MRFLGIDVGSSSIKLSVLDGESGRAIASTHYPEDELKILSSQSGWAEQDPETWWHCIEQGCKQLFADSEIDPKTIEAIGISYQMHGLVLVNHQQEVLRPAIIWCDSRAVEEGEKALAGLGSDYCFDHLLNSPGNFTGAKLRWVQQNEPEVFKEIDKIMLPGDYIAMKLSGEINTTASGLSEAALWDYKKQSLAQELLDFWGIDSDLIPSIVPSIGMQGVVCESAAQILGLKAGTKISYRGGDQANNAFSLNVLEAGELAATAGTSGVIYGVTDQAIADRESRVNTFLHINNTAEQNRNGVLLCVNGVGRSYSWLRQLLSLNENLPSYDDLNSLAAEAPVGSDGLIFQPFGNGAERMLQNKIPGAQLKNIDLNRHSLSHIVRATQEGIVFALNMGFDVLKSLGLSCDSIKVARGNMFLSETFCDVFANTTQTTIELFDTDGAEGAARAAALGCAYYASADEAFDGLKSYGEIEPSSELTAQYEEFYGSWLQTVEKD